jgi:hypothetical protein
VTSPLEEDWDSALQDLLAEGPDTPDAVREPPAEHLGPDGVAAPEAAVLVFGVGDKHLLAAFLKGPQIAARTVASRGMGFAVLDCAAETEAIRAARTASDTLKGVPVFLMRHGATEDPAAADIQAYLYVDGEEIQRPAPGLVLAQSPPLLEDLLIDAEAAEAALARAVDGSALSPADAIGIIGRSMSGGTRRALRRRRGRAE